MSAAPWLAPHAVRLAELAPLDPVARVARLDAWARDAAAATESGRPLRFVPDTGDAPRGAASQRSAYEARIFETGEVATRTDSAGARHDLYNALAWLAWPRTKARLNALHAVEIGRAGPGAPRGTLRDAATVFDENAAVWVGLDASLEDALRAFDWQGLFVARRDAVVRGVRVHAFGHALLEKLEAPFKAITAHAWPLRLPADAPPDVVDGALAASLEPARLSTRAFCPLPVMGLPEWCDANRDPAFYNDATVFRPGRRRDRP
ncbi:MAG: hypothetical protein RJA99_2103 [Pseudomonadota bacterium]|jgi:hypothetical protein